MRAESKKSFFTSLILGVAGICLILGISVFSNHSKATNTASTDTVQVSAIENTLEELFIY